MTGPKQKKNWPYPPGDDDPVTDHALWLVRCAALFDEIAIEGGSEELPVETAWGAAEDCRRRARDLTRYGFSAVPGTPG